MSIKHLIVLLIVSGILHSALSAQQQFVETLPNVSDYALLGDVKYDKIPTYNFSQQFHFTTRIILVINKDLYSNLQNQVDNYIQSLFDDEIEVIPYLVDHKQFLVPGESWDSRAGLKLKAFIKKVYVELNNSNHYPREKQGLILLGKLPFTFINWQQDARYFKHDMDPTYKKYTLHAENDFKNLSIHLQWQNYGVAGISKSILICYISPDSDFKADIDTLTVRCSLKNKYTFKIPEKYRTGKKYIKFTLHDLDNQDNIFIARTSNKVEWWFKINPCDYVLADIDGFNTILAEPLTYQEGTTMMLSHPFLVVTKDISANLDQYEWSVTDNSENNLLQNPDRGFARAEMYYGRIDASTIAEDESEEMQLISSYLSKNIKWRKNVEKRDMINNIFLFQDTTFTEISGEKSQVADIWRNNATQTRVLLQNAKTPGILKNWHCKDSLLTQLKKPWDLVDLHIHGSHFKEHLSTGEEIESSEAQNLYGSMRFLINHCCENLHIAASKNIGTAFFINNGILAEWGWAGAGTIEHDILHKRFANGDRFGVAVLKNSDSQMTANNANPWRSYFINVVGDPTLRLRYVDFDIDHRTPTAYDPFWWLKFGGLLSKINRSLFSTNEPASQNHEIEMQYALSWTGGLFFEHFFNSLISVETGLVYAEKYAKSQSINKTNKYDQTRFRMINLPVFFKYHFGKTNIRPFIGAGFEASYLFEMKHGYYNQEGQRIYFEDIGTSEEALLKSIKSPFIISAGMSIGLRLGKINLEMRYSQSINDIVLSPVTGFSDQSVNIGKIKTLTAMLGYSL
ncbi:PorT family protein [bacterium]|nr:PorT family protein [bacterium]